MMRILQPWFENISKRQVKTPKVYFRDMGILLALLKQLRKNNSQRQLFLGHIWKVFALEQTLQTLEIRREEVFTSEQSHGAELDLLIPVSRKTIRGSSLNLLMPPKRTKSMHMASTDLKLNHLYLIYPWKRDYSLEDHMSIGSVKTSLSDFCGKFLLRRLNSYFSRKDFMATRSISINLFCGFNTNNA